MGRGSEELRKHWERGGFVVEDELVSRLVDVTGDFEVDNILVKGQPRPDWMRASFTVKGDEICGNGVRDILQIIAGLGSGPGGRITVFPKGIPADLYTIQVELGGQ
jgi:hypothetical protein